MHVISVTTILDGRVIFSHKEATFINMFDLTMKLSHVVLILSSKLNGGLIITFSFSSHSLGIVISRIKLPLQLLKSFDIKCLFVYCLISIIRHMANH